MKSKSYKRQIAEYKEKYGNLPFTKEELLITLSDELKLKQKDFDKIQEMEDYAKSIPWNTLKVILPIIPKGTPRPRQGKFGFYVTGAAENKKLCKYYIEEVHEIIYTQSYFTVITYMPTPISSMNKLEIYRAEMGSISPPVYPDWDNLGKTYSDMVQDILILNDNIITKGHVEKYFSIKPRVEIIITYQKGFDSKYSKRRIQSSKAYKDAIECGYPIQIYDERNGFW